MQITKEEIKEIMSAEGDVRGTPLKTDEGFVLRNFGEEGIVKAEKEMENMGHPLKYSEISGMDFYPIGIRILSIIAIANALNLDDEKIKEMGFSAPKTSLLIKFFMKHFLSPEKTFARAGDMWSKHYTVGTLKAVNIDTKNNILILHLSGLNIHPVFCTYLTGYFKGVGKLVVQKEADTKESKCSHKGDDVHEFVVKW